MFTNLFFLILNLLLISTAIDQQSSFFFKHDPGTAFIVFLFSFACFLWFLFKQSSWLREKCLYPKDTIILIANIEILIFFSFFYFFIGSQRWLTTDFKPFGITLFSIFSLGLYFGALFTSHYAIETHRNRLAALNQSWLAICFLLPFIFPFLLLSFLNDASSLSLFNQMAASENPFNESHWQIILFTAFNLLIIILTIIFLPPLAVMIWKCPKMEDSALKDALNTLCKHAHFKHAGFRIWKIINHSMTAAIIGVVSKLRYILFTQKLIETLPSRNIVAILAHEIGHSYHMHLFIYPFILLGMVVAASLVSVMVLFPMFQYVNLQEYEHTFIPLLSFIFFGLTMALYFRFILGYFSRIFERQADLHIFKLNIPAEDMIEALDKLAIFAGNIHHEPNWHHYSIQERIDNIKKADLNRFLITRHSKLVRLSLVIYFILLTVFIFLLWSLIR